MKPIVPFLDCQLSTGLVGAKEHALQGANHPASSVFQREKQATPFGLCSICSDRDTLREMRRCSFSAANRR
jgi:hypothetical protein